MRRSRGPTALNDHISSNKRRTWVLTAAFVAVTGLVLFALGLLAGAGPAGSAVVGLGVAAATAFLLVRRADRIVLSMSRAEPAGEDEYARYHNLVEGLCAAAGLPKPALYVIDDDAPNAFAVGRDPKHASVAVTTGLLRKLSRVELEAVLAHELSHIRSHDVGVSTAAVTLVGGVVVVADWASGSRWGGVLAVPFLALARIAGRLMPVALGGRRETLADVTGVGITRYPPGLIAALEKLRDQSTIVHSGSCATAHLWIAPPVPRTDAEGPRAWLGRLVDTHPPLDQRIEALREL